MREWEDNIKADLEAMWCEVVELTYFAQGRVGWRANMNMVIELRAQ
jgi:hypothetical protein